MNWNVEWINYEKVRGRRELRGGKIIDHFTLTKDPNDSFYFIFVGTLKGRAVVRYRNDWDTLQNELPLPTGAPWFAEWEYSYPEPTPVLQVRTSESDWIEEVKYGKGSFIKWKENYQGIIFDEAHRCGGATSLQSKLMIGAKRQATYGLALSATAADDPRQMKALGYFLGLHDLSKGKNNFRNWLFNHGCSEFDEVPGMHFTTNDVKRREVFAGLSEEIFPDHGDRMRKRDIPGFPHSKIDVKFISDHTNKAKELIGSIAARYEEMGELIKQSSLYVHKRQQLEMLLVPSILEYAEDAAQTSSVVIFVNYTETLNEILTILHRKYGPTNVIEISGAQVGERGKRERQDGIDRFQRNVAKFAVVNTHAGSENVSLHDPNGVVERTTITSPPDSGRVLQQIFGRVERVGAAASNQWILLFAGTEQEKTAERVMARVENIELFNNSFLV